MELLTPLIEKHARLLTAMWQFDVKSCNVDIMAYIEFKVLMYFWYISNILYETNQQFSLGISVDVRNINTFLEKTLFKITKY